MRIISQISVINILIFFLFVTRKKNFLANQSYYAYSDGMDVCKDPQYNFYLPKKYMEN